MYNKNKCNNLLILLYFVAIYWYNKTNNRRKICFLFGQFGG